MSVSGALGALTKFLSTFENFYIYNLSLILLFLAFIWHILGNDSQIHKNTINYINSNFLGSYWVYKEYQPNYEAAKGKYCTRTAYLLAFWALTFQYTMLILFVTLAGCHMLMRNEFTKLED